MRTLPETFYEAKPAKQVRNEILGNLVADAPSGKAVWRCEAEELSRGSKIFVTLRLWIWRGEVSHDLQGVASYFRHSRFR